MRKWLFSLRPSQLLVYGYFTILILGFLLLCIPLWHERTVSTLDHFFIATSALSTTGLATISVSDTYGFAGEFIVLILIQIGGLGYMSLGSFIVLIRKRRIEGIGKKMILNDFSLPEGFSVNRFIRDLIYFSLLLELMGALLLTAIFWYNGEQNPLWMGLFHSISAFCTAGFSLFNDSFVGYQDNFYLNAIIAILSLAGAVGFIVFTDIYSRIRGRAQRLTLTSRIILRFTATGIALGTTILFLSDGSISTLPPEDRLLVAFFQSMSAFSTVGFNSMDISLMASAPLFFVVLLMIVGASPSGTGGGMKSTTFTALYAQLKSTFLGRKGAVYMGRQIPDHRLRAATSNFFFYVMIICLGTYLLLLLQPQPLSMVLFEAVSALGTVGLSIGLTGDLSVLGKWIIIALMFLGRIGPLSFGLALFGHQPDQNAPRKIPIEEDLAI